MPTAHNKLIGQLPCEWDGATDRGGIGTRRICLNVRVPVHGPRGGNQSCAAHFGPFAYLCSPLFLRFGTRPLSGSGVRNQ